MRYAPATGTRRGGISRPAYIVGSRSSASMIWTSNAVVMKSSRNGIQVSRNGGAASGAGAATAFAGGAWRRHPSTSGSCTR